MLLWCGNGGGALGKLNTYITALFQSSELSNSNLPNKSKSLTLNILAV